GRFYNWRFYDSASLEDRRPSKAVPCSRVVARKRDVHETEALDHRSEPDDSGCPRRVVVGIALAHGRAIETGREDGELGAHQHGSGGPPFLRHGLQHASTP